MEGYLFVECSVLRISPLDVEQDDLVIFVLHDTSEVFHHEARPLLIYRPAPKLSSLFFGDVFLSQQCELIHVVYQISKVALGT